MGDLLQHWHGSRIANGKAHQWLRVMALNDRYLAGVATLRLPEEDAPPNKTKILVLSKYGILSIGHWEPDFYVAWCPLPKIPPHIKDRMRLKSGTQNQRRTDGTQETKRTEDQLANAESHQAKDDLTESLF